MPESSLRWGTRLGALGAGLGVFAYIVGALLTPLPSRQTASEAVITIVFLRGLFVLVALGVTLGLSYFAGMRVGRETAASSSSITGTNDRLPSALAGGLVILIYWLVTRFVDVLIAFPPFQKQGLSVQDLVGLLVVGFFLVAGGVGLGGFGARTVTTNRLAETVIVMPATSAPAPITSVSTAPSPTPAAAVSPETPDQSATPDA